jgi:hypothetical protein
MDAVPVDEREFDAPPPLKLQQWEDKRREKLKNRDGLVFDKESEVRSKVAEPERGFDGWFD